MDNSRLEAKEAHCAKQAAAAQQQEAESAKLQALQAAAEAQHAQQHAENVAKAAQRAKQEMEDELAKASSQVAALSQQMQEAREQSEREQGQANAQVAALQQQLVEAHEQMSVWEYDSYAHLHAAAMWEEAYHYAQEKSKLVSLSICCSFFALFGVGDPSCNYCLAMRRLYASDHRCLQCDSLHILFWPALWAQSVLGVSLALHGTAPFCILCISLAAYRCSWSGTFSANINRSTDHCRNNATHGTSDVNDEYGNGERKW